MTTLAQWWSGSKLKIFASDEDAKMFGHENCFFIFVKTEYFLNDITKIFKKTV